MMMAAVAGRFDVDDVARCAHAIEAAAGKTVAFIGAGCSASSGVPTFAGEGAAGSLLFVREDALKLPTYAHRAVARLLEAGLVAHVVSSNHDGLISGEHVSEVFGCVFGEICLACKTRFRRTTVTPSLGRQCELCGTRRCAIGCHVLRSRGADPRRQAEEDGLPLRAGDLPAPTGGGGAGRAPG